MFTVRLVIWFGAMKVYYTAQKGTQFERPGNQHEQKRVLVDNLLRLPLPGACFSAVAVVVFGVSSKLCC